ncbi:uncharacterized protein LOC123541430 [Mercenaria mercenaria]|uniref:uncharacterized protein LOC123541430 n=1 Tax=Mercenaria mercenaria TaxID=6596 RepID=UPI00234E883B|nr:uncharacterized protein LOC123541430 [Mercenaria mercenaria]
MEVWIIFLILQLLRSSVCHEEHIVDTGSVVSGNTTVTTAATENVRNPITCCSLRMCPRVMLCIEYTNRWGCRCALTEEQKRRREEQAQAVRERLRIVHEHNHG